MGEKAVDRFVRKEQTQLSVHVKGSHGHRDGPVVGRVTFLRRTEERTQR